MNHKVTFAHSPFCPSFPSFPVQKLTETKTSVKKLEFLSFSPIWADANKYMCVTSTEVFLLLFLGNYKWTEKGGILVRSFTHHLYSNPLVKHSSLILSLFYDSVEKWTVCPWVMKWRMLLGSYTLEQNTKILIFTRIPIWRQFKPLSLAINLVTW